MAAEKPRRYKHANTVVALLVIACVLAPIAGTSIWIKNQVTETPLRVNREAARVASGDLRNLIE
jgi:hypothetical protein